MAGGASQGADADTGDDRRPCNLTEPQEADLREYFGGALAEVGGARSPLGSILERIKHELPPGGGRGAPSDHHDEIVMAVQRERRVRRRLLHMQDRQAVEVLRTLYSAIPAHLALDGGTTIEKDLAADEARQRTFARDIGAAFGGRETAAVVALLTPAGPGEGRWAVLAALVRTTRVDKKSKDAQAAKEEIDRLRVAARLEMRRARALYIEAIVAVAAEERDERERRRAHCAAELAKLVRTRRAPHEDDARRVLLRDIVEALS